MDRYEKLKDEALCRLLGYRQKLEVIKKQINGTSCSDLVVLLELSDGFRECLYDLQAAEVKYASLKDKEQEIRQMFKGFYDEGAILRSFIYTDIYKVCPSDLYSYRVKYSYFKTLDEAKKYSISLGKTKDWLARAYRYL